MKAENEITARVIEVLELHSPPGGSIAVTGALLHKFSTMGEASLRHLLALYFLGMGTRRKFTTSLELASHSPDPEGHLFELFDTRNFAAALRFGITSFNNGSRHYRDSVLRRKRP